MAQAMQIFASDKDTTIIGGQSVASLRDTAIDRSLTTELGHDRAYVLAPNGKVLRASADGRYAGFTFNHTDGAIVSPIIERLRHAIADVEFDDPALEWKDMVGLSQVEIVSFGHGEVGFVGVRPIDPPEDATSYRDAGFLLASIKLIDQPFLAELGQYLGVTNLHRSSRPVADASMPLLDRRGNVLGYLAWTPTLPARGLILEAAPALALLLAVGCALMGFLLASLRRTSLRLEASQAHATYFALHDPLTGAANRTLFETRLQEAKDYRYLAETKVLLVAIDVDHFKEVNDTWGHAAGDELLKEVARRLRMEMPEEATVARLGGDEFAVIHPGVISEGQARWICNRLLQCARAPIQITGERLEIGLSVGGALEPGDTSSEEMLRRSDVALYAAKMDGRDRFALYDPVMDQEKRERRKLEVELRNALLTGEGLHLVYQPIFSAKTNDIATAEALLRWMHPTRGMVPPDEFIGLAEECGVIEQLGNWVLREAVRFTVASGLPRVAVNFSPVQFRNERLAEEILGVLKEEGLAPDRLEVEITEGMLLQDSPQVQSALKTLRAAGVSVALDDFGTGYASISYLRNYEVDKLKIDQSYTRQILTDPAVAQIVRLVIGTAQALGMKITAEGVEDAKQRDTLTAMGCTYLQGYFFSRPLSADVMQATLERRPVLSAKVRKSL